MQFWVHQERSILLALKPHRIKIILWIILAVFSIAGARWYYGQFVGPETLNQDESAILLNAILLKESGADEWAQSWPLLFRSFGDIKLPGYIYSVLATLLLFGNNLWAARFPSFLAGIALPFILFAWTHKLTRSSSAGLFAAVFLLLSPWSWHYGTTGYEAHVALVLLLSGLWLWWNESRNWWKESLGACALFLACFTYNTPFLLLPFLTFAFMWQALPQWKVALRRMLICLIIFSVVAFVTFGAAQQKSGVTVFQDATLFSQYPEYRAQWSGALQSIVGNKYVFFGTHIVKNWISSWSWRFLVTKGGGNPWHSIPGIGHLHFLVPALAVCTLPFLVFLQKKKKALKPLFLLLFLIGVSLAPAAVTVDAPHATRSLLFFLLLTVLGGWGAAEIYGLYSLQMGKKWWWRGTLFIMASLVIWGFVQWWTPAKTRWTFLINPRWNAGLIEQLQSQEFHQAADVTILDPHGVLYTYVLLFDPEARMQFNDDVQRSQPDNAGLVRVEQFGKYHFVFSAEDAKVPTLFLQPRSVFL